MARLSNLFRRDDERPEPTDRPVVCRPAKPHEIRDAIRLLLASSHGLASERQANEFLHVTGRRGVDSSDVWIARRESADGSQTADVEWTLLPVTSPGKTMLLLTPSYLYSSIVVEAAQALTEAVCREYASRGIELAQLLLDPNEPNVQTLYTNAGFTRLAELIYLNRTVKRAPSAADVALPPDLELIQYHPDHTHERFARAVMESYEGSLDCPGLNGVRDIRDVLDGHKAAGEFDSRLWSLVVDRTSGAPRAVLLLNRSLYADALELVYLGLVPAARGSGLSNVLMHLALAAVLQTNRNELTLAVDAQNAPALGLYYRFGMQRISSRVAMVRALRDQKSEVRDQI